MEDNSNLDTFSKIKYLFWYNKIGSDNMDYKLDQFEGPLDLLLHLIRKQEIEIKDIKIEEITGQYLEYIRQMEEMNLDIASEYRNNFV